MLDEIPEIIDAITDVGAVQVTKHKKDSVLQLISVLVFIACAVALVFLAGGPLVLPPGGIMKPFAICLGCTLLLMFVCYKIKVLRNISLTTLVFFFLATLIMCFTALFFWFPQMVQ